MTSAVEICNMALNRIGSNEEINAIDTTNATSRACLRWYEHCRDEVIQHFPWAFALRTVALAEVPGAALPGWTYAYRWPNDCLAPRMLTTDAGNRLGYIDRPILRSDFLDLRQFVTQPIPYMVHSDATGQLISTDLDVAYLWYTAKITDPEQFKPLFISTLAWRLGVELGATVKADQRLIAQANTAWQAALTMSAGADLNGQAPDPRQESPSIAVR